VRLGSYVWTEHPGNPILSPRFPGLMIADPTVLMPEETPDGRWHLFANSMPPRLHHFASEDGIRWCELGTLCPGAMRPFVRRVEGEYVLLYEQVRWPAPLRSRILLRRSTDLGRWGPAAEMVRPSLPWHGRFHRTCGNPCLVPWCGEWLLFYSAGVVFLPDCGFFEPRHVGLARSASPLGPWRCDPEPVLSPDPGDPLRNLGAGAIKVIPDVEAGVLWGFNNGIHRDAHGRSRSSVLLLSSRDGMRWRAEGSQPVLAPGGEGWKKALVYALDARVLADAHTVRIYFNARDGWFFGRERIGLAVGVSRTELG